MLPSENARGFAYTLKIEIVKRAIEMVIKDVRDSPWSEGLYGMLRTNLGLHQLLCTFYHDLPHSP